MESAGADGVFNSSLGFARDDREGNRDDGKDNRHDAATRRKIGMFFGSRPQVGAAILQSTYL